MKPERTFVAERALAQHCPELVRRAPEPAELLGRLGALGDRLARAMAPSLAPFCGGEPPLITARPVREVGEGELKDILGSLAANMVITGAAPGVSLLGTFSGEAVFRLLDRAFGGRGDALSALPDAFPPSAERMLDRLEPLLAQALASALAQGQAAPPELRVVRREAKLDELRPFPACARLAVLTLEVSEGGQAPWVVTVALPMAVLPKILGGLPMGKHETRSADPAGKVFGDMPLPIKAALVDMAVPLAALADLGPGSVLPVSVARAVPVTIAGTVMAHGTVGAQDDRLAIKITSIM